MAGSGLSEAAPFTWTSSGTSPLADGSGSWNATGGTNWFNGSAYGAWGNTNADTATFGVGSGAAGTITVGGVTTNGITFNTAGSGNYTLSSGTITLANSTPTITVNASGTTRLTSVLAGSAGLSKTGAGTLALAGANTFTGGVVVSGGTLSVQGSIAANQNYTISNGALTTSAAVYNPLGLNTSGTMTINAGGLLYAGNSLQNSHNLGDIVLAGGTMAANAAGNLRANWYLNGGITATGGTTSTISSSLGRNASNAALAITVDAGSTLSVSGIIVDLSGANGLTKNGGGNLTFGNVQNTYSGGTVVNGGTLTLGNGGQNGNIRGSLTINSGATVNADAGNWSLGYGGTRAGALNSGSSVTSITINGGLLNFTNGSQNAGLTANSIVLTGGTIGGGSFGWYNSYTLTPTLQTLASSTRSTLSGGIALRITTSGTLTFDVASGSTSDSIDLLVSGPIITATGGGDGAGGAIAKTGAGRMVLSGSNSYTGATDVTAGTLAVNGSLASASAVTVAASATLGGSGSIAGAITGAGLVSPGNSPGILTAGQFNPSVGLDAAFEFTGLAPTYTSASASVNDILRLTNGSAPFAAGTFTAGNAIDVYFNVDSIANGQIYEGGFFTGLLAVDLLAALDGKASFSYWVKTTGAGTRSFGGVNYVDITTITGITGVTLQTSYGTKDFGGSVGNVTGSVTQFVIVPEPGSLVIAGIGISLACWVARARRRGNSL
jgi:autotransporter-associated beta strand protein